jgi:hypothetical protein
MPTKRLTTRNSAAAHVTHMLCYAGPAGENIGLAAGSQEEARTCDVGVLSAWEGQSDVTPEIPMETVAYNKQSPPPKELYRVVAYKPSEVQQ